MCTQLTNSLSCPARSGLCSHELVAAGVIDPDEARTLLESFDINNDGYLPQPKLNVLGKNREIVETTESFHSLERLGGSLTSRSSSR